MNTDEALREVANLIAQVMIDLGYLESEAARAADLIVSGSTEALRDSILADVIERDGTRFRMFVAFDDSEAAGLIWLAGESGASVSASCSLLDTVQVAWLRLWGNLEPSSEAW